MEEVPAVGRRKQAGTANAAGGSLSQRPRTGNGIGGSRRKFATQVTESVSPLIVAFVESV
jgi:hypothetical protein